jgi:hypothetical protein
MNPYPDRIAQLHGHLAARRSQRDTQATEILLAALLPQSLTRMRRPWLVLETDYLSRDTSDAWFSLGMPQTVQARSLAIPRVMRRDPGHEYIESILQERSRVVPGVFTDAEWRALQYAHGGWTKEPRANYHILMSMCVRLRVAHPKGDAGVQVEREADRLELARLTRRVLDSSHRTPRASTALAVSAEGGVRARDVPKSLFYWCELLQKVSPAQQDWESLTGSLAAIARGIALLYNDGRPPAWDASERVLRDSVPYATGWLMAEAAKAPAVGRTTYIKSGGDMMSHRRTVLELRRLHREGVLLKRQGHKGVVGTVEPWKYRLGAADWHTLLDRDTRILL